MAKPQKSSANQPTEKKKPGVQSKFQAAELEFLEAKLPSYLNAHRTHSTRAFWTPLFKEWWSKFLYQGMCAPAAEVTSAPVSSQAGEASTTPHNEPNSSTNSRMQSPVEMSEEELQAKANEVKAIVKVCHVLLLSLLV